MTVPTATRPSEQGGTVQWRPRTAYADSLQGRNAFVAAETS